MERLKIGPSQSLAELQVPLYSIQKCQSSEAKIVRCSKGVRLSGEDGSERSIKVKLSPEIKDHVPS